MLSEQHTRRNTQVKIVNDLISTRVQELFSTQIIKPIELKDFINNGECDTCEEAIQPFEVLAELAEKISLSINNIDEYPKLVQQYNVQNTPMLVICGRDQDKTIDYGIRFLVLPSGYKFSSLIQAIGLVSKRASCLMPETRKEIKALQIPLQLKVFVTPT